MTRKAIWLAVLSIFMGAVFILGSSLMAAAGEAPKYGGSLKMLNLGARLNPLTWDIADWQWKHGHDTGLYMEHLFMGDLQKGPRGTNEFSFTASAWIPPEVMRGELAESWEKKTNPLRLVFHLRQGIYWQEKPGVMPRREFVAEDVVYSMNRLATSRKAVPDYLTFIDKWVAEDKHTVVAYLNKWNANWPYRFGWGYFDAIQAPEQEKAGAKDWKNACGTGPYMITNYKTGHSQTYTRNKDYWDTDIIDGKEYKLPFTDEVVYMIIKDKQTRLSALKTGKVDMALLIEPQDVPDLKKSLPQLQWSKYLYTGGYMVALRMDTKPFDDIRVRRALNLAVNQQEIIDTLYEGEGELVNYTPSPLPSKASSPR